MARFRSDYMRTPTDESSFTEKSWKSAANTLLEEHGAIHQTKDEGSYKSRFWAWWDKTSKQDTVKSMRWRPLSMTTPILSALIVASCLMVAAIEILAQKSQKQGGLALSPSLDEIPQYAMITSQYVPQILAVFYSLVWSWIDLDVKRMQPWIEMSKPEGATAKDSLLLDYPFTFVAAVPFQAAKRGHWMVFLSGTAMVLVFWAVTPLQSAQIGTGAVSLNQTRSIVSRSVLPSIEKQVDLLGPEIMSIGYSVAWLDQPFPSFTTKDESYLPFYVDNTDAPAKSGVTWTASTTVLSSDLNCWPAEVSKRGPESAGMYDFLNGQGCNVSLSMTSSGQYSMRYISYWSSPFSDSWLAGPACPATRNSTHQSLAIWSMPLASSKAKDFDMYSDFDINAMYCQTEYYKQDVKVTVSADSLKPDTSSMVPISDRKTLSESEFNSTAFEFLLANGMPYKMEQRDHPNSFVVEQTPKLLDYNLTIPSSNMVGYALAGGKYSTSDLASHQNLHEVYRRAQKYLFSVAVSQLLVNETSLGNGSATATFPLHGILVSRPISAALQALLFLVAVFTAILIWLCQTSVSNLRVNPSSVSRIIEVFRNSPVLLESFKSADSLDDKNLFNATNSERFRLIWNESKCRHEITLRKGSVIDEDRINDASKTYYDPVRPFVLRKTGGVIFFAAVLGVIIALAYFKWAEIRFHGLKRPSSNQEVQQILENYIPTILSTLIEPFWILVNRLLCVLQPFKDLWAGKARADDSISSTYTSIPPQFVVWRAIKSRHFVLCIVCTAVFLANILTVSMPVIFQEGQVMANYTESFNPHMANAFRNESVYTLLDYLSNNSVTSATYQDHNYAALANITLGTPLPPWVTDKYFFQPWNLTTATMDSEADVLRLKTRGFGARFNCTSIAPHELPLLPRVEPPEWPNATYCGDWMGMARTEMRETEKETSSGVSAVEFVGTPSKSLTFQCDTTLILGWGRSQKSQDVNGTVEGSFAICRPIFETAMFEIEIDKSGYVLSYKRISDLDSTLDYPNADNHVDLMISNANNIISPGAMGWHNDTLTRDWVNYFLMELTHSRDILDPHKPPPNPEDLLPLVDEIYRKLFALLLGLLKDHIFQEPESKKPIQGMRVVEETRLFLDPSAFTISMTLLGVNIVIALLFYVRGVAFVLPRMPTTIGSIIAFVAPSRLVSSSDRSSLALQNQTFSFGRYIGRDGATHVGIEMDPHVVPIDPSSLKGKRGKEWFGFRTPRNQKHPFPEGPWL